MPPQQNSRKSELMADFGSRCPLRVFEKATGLIRSREAVPPRPKTPSASAALRKSVPTLEWTFSTQSATSRHMHCSKNRAYSITSSARASSLAGSSRAKHFSVLRLIIFVSVNPRVRPLRHKPIALRFPRDQAHLPTVAYCVCRKLQNQQNVRGHRAETLADQSPTVDCAYECRDRSRNGGRITRSLF